MIPWWVGVILLITGVAIGITVMAICAGSWDKAEERERRMAENLGLLYPENKKAADAGTSTADRETVRKDYFL